MTLLKELLAARPAAVTRPSGRVVLWENTPLRRYLTRKPGRCSCCAAHIATQGHAPGCLFGPRAWLTLLADGSWTHNPGTLDQPSTTRTLTAKEPKTA